MFPPSPINPPTAKSISRKPAFSVLLNGSTMLPAYEAEITNTAHFSADTFRVCMALSKMPPGLGASYWADSANDQVKISLGVNDETPLPFILGQVDDAEIDFMRKTLTLTGRDPTGVLIDTKTTQIFQNLTSSQIVAQIIAKHPGMTGNISPTTTKVGSYYQSDAVPLAKNNVALSREESEWDLLVFLAQHEGYDLYFTGNTLNFQPSIDLTKTVPYALIYSDDGQSGAGRFSSFMDLKCKRSQTLAKDVIVNVRSWNQLSEATFQVSYRRNQANKGQRSGGAAQIYSFTVPNLTNQQARNYAMQKAEEITRQERVITVELPGDNTLSMRTGVQLVGTGTSYDQFYYPDTITRKTDFKQYRMTMRAKNHSTQSTVIL